MAMRLPITTDHPITLVILDITDADRVAALDGLFLDSLEAVIIASGLP
ncbi:hypothetical protein [Mycobacterium lepromatosis]|nr:hypothetical protein [Mycobacterium lepromatosis]UKN42412.1 hypothetical protein MLPF_1816 [Mycobacterium lepromatosis]